MRIMFKCSCYFTHSSLYLAIMLGMVCFQQLSQLLMVYIIAVLRDKYHAS